MKVQKLQNSEEFGRFREPWNNLLLASSQNGIFLTHQWFTAWWKCFSENRSLEVFVFKDDQEEWQGIAPLMRDGDSLRFLASQEVTDYCDFVVFQNREEEVYRTLLKTIRKDYPDIEVVELMNLKSESAAVSILPSLATEEGFECSLFISEVAPFLELPTSYEDFLSGMKRKNRHELKRKLKRMSQLEGAQLEEVTDQQSLQTWIQAFIELHRKSDRSKREFWEKTGMTDFFLEIVHQFSPEKWLELSLLLDGKKPVALLLNFLYGDEIDFYNAAYDKTYAWYTPGLYLFHHRLSKAISEGKRKADFLRGREKYKYYFGAKDSKILNLVLTSGAGTG
jgi:CelD/BcsL family acetyltransferase involved in cellulose biosynthesis